MVLKNDFQLLNSLIEEVHSKTSEYSAPLDFLMIPDFISCHSNFKTFQCIKSAIGLIEKYSNEKDLFTSIEWNCFIRKNTVFNTWRDMRLKATVIYVKYKLPLHPCIPTLI